MKYHNINFFICFFIVKTICTSLEIPFGVGFLQRSPIQGFYFGAAHSSYSGQNKIRNNGLFKITNSMLDLQSLTPENVTINITNQNQLNPLYDQGIRALTFISPEQKDLPTILVDSDLQRVYAFENSDGSSLLISEIINDSQGLESAMIEGLAGTTNGTVFTIVHPHEGIFGEVGTGVALLARGYIGNDNHIQRIFTQVILNKTITNNPSAYPFDITSQAFILNNHKAQAISDPVICWDDVLNCLYIGVTGTGSTNSDGGIKGIGVLNMQNNNPRLTSFVSDSIVQETGNLLFAQHGSSASVSVNQINIMHSSTGLPYLLALCNTNGVNKLQVVPLVDDQSSNQGMIAAKNSPIQTLLLESPQYTFFQKRFFNQVAESPSDLFSETDSAVLIGNDQTISNYLYQYIQNFSIEGDTVFITVYNAIKTEESGIFASRALFDNDGRIVAWTQWEKQYQEKSFFIAVPDFQNGGFYSAKGQNSTALTTLSKNNWKKGSESSLSLLAELYQKYSFNPLSLTKTIFEQNRINNALLFAAGSYGKCLLYSFGHINENQIAITQPITNGQETIITQATRALAENTIALVFSDPIIESLGFITDCNYGYHRSSSSYPDEEFLIIAGTNGAALLASNTGTGWSISEGIGKNFANIPLPAHWFLLTNQSVKKIISDNQYSYLISNTQIIRINLNNSNLLTGEIDKTIIAQSSNFSSYATFVDFIPSSSHAIVATTNGLFYTRSTSNIQTDTINNIEWEAVTLSESINTIQQIQAVTQSGITTSLTEGPGSQIIIVATSKASKQGTIARANIDSSGMITCFNDQRIQSIQSNFIDYGKFIKNIYSNGALWYALIESSINKLIPTIIGGISLEPQTAFLGLMPAYIQPFNTLNNFFPISFIYLPIGIMMLTTDNEFYITE